MCCIVPMLACGLLATASGCATVFSKSEYAVTVDNTGGPTFFSVYDRKDQVIHQGVTPQQVTLDAKAFPFWPASYSVVHAGSELASQKQEVRATFDPWVAGNLLVGGGAGIVVDGATGAMFRLPKSISGSVPAHFAVVDRGEGSQLVAAAFSTTTPRIAQQNEPATAERVRVADASASTGTTPQNR